MIKTSSKQDFIKRLFRYNLREKLLAALCSAVILIVAVCLKPVNRVYTVRVNANVSSDQVLVSENTGSVEVKVSGNFFELRKVKTEDLVMNFDFSKEPAGEITMNIGDNELPAVFLPLDVKDISPDTLVFRTEERKAESASEAPAPEEDAAGEAAESAPAETSPEVSPQPEQPANGDKNE